MREIVLDTETTGFSPQKGDRVVEIGCIELHNHIPTQVKYHTFINPKRDMPKSAYDVHGISSEFLEDKPLFLDIADEFLNFIGSSPLIIHNAKFDLNFINHHLEEIKKPLLKNEIIDTLELARAKNPLGQNSLDALCKQFNIDTSNRTKHGAIIDCELLAEVYIELIGGKQTILELSDEKADSKFNNHIHNLSSTSINKSTKRIEERGGNSSERITQSKTESRTKSRVIYGVSDEEFMAHKKLNETKINNSLWQNFFNKDDKVN